MTDTSARPEPVRLTDLADPEFSPDARAIVDAVGGMAADVELNGDALMTAAAAQTGLDDFGPMDFVERMDVLLAALDTEAGLSPMGRVSAGGMITGLLVNRLLLTDLLAPPPRDPRRRDRGADGDRRAAPHRHHPPPQPHLGRPGAALAPLLGEHPAGAVPRRGRAGRHRRRPPHRPHRDEPRRHGRAHAALQAHARDDHLARARGDPAPRHRLLHDALRHDGPDAVVARVLPGPRPDPALRVHEDGAQGDAVAARRRALDPEVAAAPRAVRPADLDRSPTPPCSSPTATPCR